MVFHSLKRPGSVLLEGSPASLPFERMLCLYLPRWFEGPTPKRKTSEGLGAPSEAYKPELESVPASDGPKLSWTSPKPFLYFYLLKLPDPDAHFIIIRAPALD